MSTYYAYRVFLNKAPQINLFDNRSKEEHYLNIFTQLEENHRAQFTDYGAELFIYFHKRINDKIIICHLAKKQEYEKPLAEADHIERTTDIKYPFVHLVFHIKRQIVLIEKNTTAFQQIETVQNKVEKYLNIGLAQASITASLGEISDNREFWSKVSKFDMVEDIEFDYKPPNFFGGANEADRIVKEVHEETNFRKFKIFLENKFEGLKFNKENFGDHIKRLASGAGNFIVHGVIDGIKQVAKNITTIVSKPINDIEMENEESLETTFEEIDKLNEDENS